MQYIKAQKINKLISILIICLALESFSFAQEISEPKEYYPPPEMNANGLYLNVGYLLLYATLNVNYERIIKQHLGPINLSVFAKAGAGIFTVWGGDGGYSMAQIGLLTGENKHHLELSGGVCIDRPQVGWGDEPLGYPIAASIGWRIQNPTKNFIFRLGAGVPEGVYVGLGFNF